MKRIYLALLFCLWSAPSWATCSSPISGKDGTGATINLGAVVDGSSNCWGGVSIVDGVAAANKAAVKAASTPAAAGDPALVVAINPNNAANTTPWLFNLTQVDSTALGVPTAYGVAPTTGNYIGVNAFVTNSNANGQATMANSSPTVLPSNQQVADPCMFQAKTKVAFSTTSGSTQLVALSGSTKIYVCAIHLFSTAADSISFTEGTGTACATGATAVSGSTTAASGMDFPANGGMTEGGGVGTVMATSVGGDELCLLQSGTTKIAGNLMIVQQ